MTDNPIVIENLKPGTDRAVWDAPVSQTIEGFTTDISVDQGDAISFKINLDTPPGAGVPYHIEIYRLGYYGGAGATLVTTIAGLTGGAQPDPVTDARGVVDAGNWAVSATWNTPADATSGVYLARMVRDDTGASNQTPFIIREDGPRADGSHSDIVMQTSDTTWQAYNGWAGNNGVVGGNFYGGSTLDTPLPDDPSPLGTERVFGVSYNRPFLTREGTSFASGPQDYLFGADFAAIYWAEKEGYDVSYISGVDTDRLGADALLGHKAYISLGHDEYWSGDQRLNVEAARDAGVNLLFWGGNDVYWKTRYEPSIDGTATDDRTLISYKETWANYNPTATAADYANIDPSADWTGTWRDVRFTGAVDAAGNPTAQGARPENSLTGTLFVGDGGVSDVPLTIPDALSGLRVWRDTSVAAGGTSSLAPGIIGYEWNAAVVDDSRPAGLVLLSQTAVDWPELLIDQGSRSAPGTENHSLTLYRADSGALVFSAGTVFWSWGLSNQHDNLPYDANIETVALQQFTVNLLADMGIQPGVADAVLASHGLVRATPSTDAVAATATLTDLPATIVAQTPIRLTGTATDDDGNPLTADGQVALVEVSFDNGQTWRPATGQTNWHYDWTPATPGEVTITVRAIDDSLNTPAGVLSGDVVTVTPAPPPAMSSLFDNAPVRAAAINDGASLELGVRFTPSATGQITELRYFRTVTDSGDTDVRAGHLWGADGTLLATATFTSAPGQSGWQTVALDAPVTVFGGQTYTASYHTQDFYVATSNFFTGPIANPSGQLTAAGTNNGVYAYNSAAVLPTSSYNGSNYWVDVTYGPGVPVNAAPVLTGPRSFAVVEGTTLAATLTGTDANGDPLVYAITGGADAARFTLDAQSGRLTFVTPPDFEGPTDAGGNNVYDVTVSVSDRIAAPVTAALQIAVTDGADTPPPPALGSLFAGAPVSATANSDGSAVELGVRITPTQSVTATELRYFRAVGDAGDTDVRQGHLWDASGNLVATTTFTSTPGQSGWQVAALTTPVVLTAGQTYTVSYRTQDNYVATQGYFATSHSDADNLVTAPGAGNGVYVYGSALTRPTSTYNGSNYWVDLGFTAVPGAPANAAPVFTSAASFGTVENTHLAGVLTATDADGNPIRFSIAGGADAARFSLDADSGALSFLFDPDFEAPDDAGGNNVYDLLVAAADDRGGRSTQAIQIAVADVTGGADRPQQGTLFAGTDTPARTVTDDSTTYELGVRFSAATAGTVDELRYYRGAADAADIDVRTLTLWSATGTALASATVRSDPGAVGWQVAELDAPIALTANTTYVASYGTTQNYVATGGYFATPHSGPDDFIFTPAGNNGVFAAGATGLFPTVSYNSTNYWVDVNFTPDIPAGSISEAASVGQIDNLLLF